MRGGLSVERSKHRLELNLGLDGITEKGDRMVKTEVF